MIPQTTAFWSTNAGTLPRLSSTMPSLAAIFSSGTHMYSSSSLGHSVIVGSFLRRITKGRIFMFFLGVD